MNTFARKTPRKRRPARHVSELVGKIMEPVLSRRSGMTIDLLNAWPELAGEEYRDFTRPEKINWPNRAHENEPFKPGILIVACDGARAVFFQHDLSRICARVNVFFGFSAIAKINIVQKPVIAYRAPKKRKPVNLNPQQTEKLDKILDHIDDPELKQKLEQFGRGVMARNRSKG